MFQKNCEYAEAEYIDQSVSSDSLDISRSVLKVKSQPYGPVTGDLLDSFPTQKNPILCSDQQAAVVERLRVFLSGRVGERITLKELSRFLGYSEKYASDVFQRYMGRPFSKHLKQLRLDKAISMLLEERHTMTKIAESVGFSDAFAFSHFFKRAVGCSPTEYRRQQLRQAEMA